MSDEDLFLDKVEGWLPSASDDALKRILLNAERELNERRMSSATRKPSLSKPNGHPAAVPAKFRGGGKRILAGGNRTITASSNPQAYRRLTDEHHALMRDQPTHCNAAPTLQGDMSRWKATVLGPEGTPYYGGLFHLELAFPHNYPFTAPKVTFKTPIFHPSIDERINLGLLEQDWTPECSVVQVLVSICLMLVQPGSSPTLGSSESCVQARTLLGGNRPQFEHLAKQWTARYAMR